MSACFAFVVALFAIHLLQPLAIRLGLVDLPNIRKSHEGIVPLIGGIGIAIGFAFGLISLDFSLAPYRSLIAASGVLLLTGLLDDFHELPPKSRLFAQIFSAMLITLWGQNILYDLGNLLGLGNINLGYLSIPLSIIALVAMINAFNMLDGLDGLAGSIILGILSLLGYLGFISGKIADFHILMILIMGLFGFLIYNFPLFKSSKAKVFMGDAGSMLLGLMVTWFCISFSQGNQAAASPVVFLWIVALPLFDLLSVVLRRLRAGRSPLKADREHFHHLLLKQGLSARGVVFLMFFLNFTLGAIGISASLFFHVSERGLFFSIICLFIAYILAISRCFKIDKKPQ